MAVVITSERMRNIKKVRVLFGNHRNSLVTALTSLWGCFNTWPVHSNPHPGQILALYGGAYCLHIEECLLSPELIFSFKFITFVHVVIRFSLKILVKCKSFFVYRLWCSYKGVWDFQLNHIVAYIKCLIHHLCIYHIPMLRMCFIKFCFSLKMTIIMRSFYFFTAKQISIL